MVWFLRPTSGVRERNMSDKVREEEQSLMEYPVTRTATPSRRQRNIWITLTVVNTIMFLTSVVVMTSKWQPQTGQMNRLLKETSFYSPILDRVEIPTETRRINGSLFPEANHPHRQLPSAAVEAYWDSLELVRPFPITKAELIKLGRDPATSVRFDDSLGLGREAYFAALDVIHVIHCLNSLRKMAFKDYPEYPTDPHVNHKELKWIHLAHCTDILLQNLLCMPNPDLITYNWVETESHPFPDFSIQHQCWNFDALFGWVQENSVPTEKWWGMPKTDDVAWIPQEAGYFEVFGHTGNDHEQAVDRTPYQKAGGHAHNSMA